MCVRGSGILVFTTLYVLYHIVESVVILQVKDDGSIYILEINKSETERERERESNYLFSGEVSLSIKFRI